MWESVEVYEILKDSLSSSSWTPGKKPLIKIRLFFSAEQEKHINETVRNEQWSITGI